MSRGADVSRGAAAAHRAPPHLRGQRPDERRARGGVKLSSVSTAITPCPFGSSSTSARDRDGEQRHAAACAVNDVLPEGMVHGDDAEGGAPTRGRRRRRCRRTTAVSDRRDLPRGGEHGGRGGGTSSRRMIPEEGKYAGHRARRAKMSATPSPAKSSTRRTWRRPSGSRARGDRTSVYLRAHDNACQAFNRAVQRGRRVDRGAQERAASSCACRCARAC